MGLERDVGQRGFELPPVGLLLGDTYVAQRLWTGRIMRPVHRASILIPWSGLGLVHLPQQFSCAPLSPQLEFGRVVLDLQTILSLPRIPLESGRHITDLLHL